MGVVNTCRLYEDEKGEIINLTIQRGLDATDYRNIDTLINLHLLHNTGVYFYNMLWKFGGKQCIEKDNTKIPLKYIQKKEKIYLDLICIITRKSLKEIVIQYKGLLNIVKEPLNLSRAKVENIQKILGSPSEVYVKKTLKNTTKFYANERDRVTRVIYP